MASLEFKHSFIDIRSVQVLLGRNAKVYISARNQEKGDAAIKDLKNLTGKDAIFLKVDLGDLKSVKAAAAEYMRSGLVFSLRSEATTDINL